MMNKLKIFLKDAYENVPYYHRLFDEYKIDIRLIDNYNSFQKIPLLYKSTVRNHIDDFISRKYQKEELIIEHTSGSTGKVLPVYWSKEDMLKADISLWRARKHFDVNLLSRQWNLMLYSDDTSINSKNCMYYFEKNALNVLGTKIDKTNFKKIYKVVLDYSPTVLLGSPSVIFTFVRTANSVNIYQNYTVKYVELTGEFLSETVKNQIQKFFVNAKIISQYGCRECRVIAIECPYGNFHCIEDNVFIEILKDGKPTNLGETGNIYITTLRNSAMPFIRYKLGDIGYFEKKKCICGYQSNILKLCAGRDNDKIILKNNSEISAGIFWAAVSFVNQNTDNKILEFSVIQEDYESFLVNLVPENFQGVDLIEHFFVDYLKQYCQGNKWKYKFLYFNNLASNPTSGKLKYFTSNISNKI